MKLFSLVLCAVQRETAVSPSLPCFLKELTGTSITSQCGMPTPRRISLRTPIAISRHIHLGPWSLSSFLPRGNSEASGTSAFWKDNFKKSMLMKYRFSWLKTQKSKTLGKWDTVPVAALQIWVPTVRTHPNLLECDCQKTERQQRIPGRLTFDSGRDEFWYQLYLGPLLVGKVSLLTPQIIIMT